MTRCDETNGSRIKGWTDKKKKSREKGICLGHCLDNDDLRKSSCNSNIIGCGLVGDSSRGNFS